MFERLNTPDEAFNYQLGAALKMEHTVLDKILDDSIDESRDETLTHLLRHHAEETREHIANLERTFEVLGWEPDESPCPAIEAIHKEAKVNMKKTDDSIVDSVILSGAAQTEHHEIAVYEYLITTARAMRREDVASLLQRNLEQEQHTLREVQELTARVAAAAPQQAA